ncbi:hypothetical protein NDU88_006114 [Pleurodeles waltl]|uniref:Uncharacterized protein n=1 Tax=Pleurodeles waltl TaxID=8319 RepID=A0AAV7LRI0_PLEWA|nr:hypothetical protein NDU88_006114 [Pleurodeles waltl]
MPGRQDNPRWSRGLHLTQSPTATIFFSSGCGAKVPYASVTWVPMGLCREGATPDPQAAGEAMAPLMFTPAPRTGVPKLMQLSFSGATDFASLMTPQLPLSLG